MRICHLVATTLNSHYFANLGKGLAKRGVFLHVGTLRVAPAPSWVADAPGTSHFTLSANSRVAYPRAILRLASMLRHERIDVLQTHLFDAGLVGILAKALAPQSAVVLTRHHTDQVRMVGTPFHAGLDRRMARRADRVVVLAHAVRDYVVKEDGIPAAQVDVVPQGFDFERLSANDSERSRVRQELGIESGFVVGSVGHLYPTKGHRYLLEALHIIRRDIPTVRLLLLGAGDRAPIEAQARALGLHDRIILAGFREDVPACIRAMDVVVHPSLSEAFCQVLVEAMAVGTPLVATDVGSAREVVEDGRTGLLVPPRDAGAIARAILRLYLDPDLGIHIAATGRDSVRRQFTVERMVEAQIQCYERLLQSPRGHRVRSPS